MSDWSCTSSTLSGAVEEVRDEKEGSTSAIPGVDAAVVTGVGKYDSAALSASCSA